MSVKVTATSLGWLHTQSGPREPRWLASQLPGLPQWGWNWEVRVPLQPDPKQKLIVKLAPNGVSQTPGEPQISKE